MTDIPDDAVEAAARALCDVMRSDGRAVCGTHNTVLSGPKVGHCPTGLTEARSALTAAAPHMTGPSMEDVALAVAADRDAWWQRRIESLVGKWQDEQDALRAEADTSEVAQMLAAALGGMTRQHCDELRALLREGE